MHVEIGLIHAANTEILACKKNSGCSWNGYRLELRFSRFPLLLQIFSCLIITVKVVRHGTAIQCQKRSSFCVFHNSESQKGETSQAFACQGRPNRSPCERDVGALYKRASQLKQLNSKETSSDGVKRSLLHDTVNSSSLQNCRNQDKKGSH
jgi:hypothetical protein